MSFIRARHTGTAFLQVLQTLTSDGGMEGGGGRKVGGGEGGAAGNLSAIQYEQMVIITRTCTPTPRHLAESWVPSANVTNTMIARRRRHNATARTTPQLLDAHMHGATAVTAYAFYYPGTQGLRGLPGNGVPRAGGLCHGNPSTTGLVSAASDG